MSLYYYLSANRPEDNTSASGGAIDTTIRLIDAAEVDGIAGGSADTIDLVSASAGDTQSFYLAGYDADGVWQTETVSLSGTTNVQSSNSYLHLRKAVAASNAAGIITVARYNSGSPSELFTIPVGEKGAQGLFINAQAEASGGSTKNLYEKLFIYSDDTHNDVIFANDVDEDSELTWAAEEDAGGDTTTDGTESVANRETAPTTGSPTFDEHASIAAGIDCGDAGDKVLTSGEAQGIWCKLTLAAGRATEYQVLCNIKTQLS